MLLSVLFLYSTFYALVVYFTVCRLKGINRDKSMPKSTKRGVSKEVKSQATRGLTRPPVSPETGHVRMKRGKENAKEMKVTGLTRLVLASVRYGNFQHVSHRDMRVVF